MSKGTCSPLKKLFIKSGLHRMLKGNPITSSGEDFAKSKVLSLLYDISSRKNRGLEYWI